MHTINNVKKKKISFRKQVAKLVLAANCMLSTSDAQIFEERGFETGISQQITKIDRSYFHSLAVQTQVAHRVWNILALI